MSYLDCDCYTGQARQALIDNFLEKWNTVKKVVCDRKLCMFKYKYRLVILSWLCYHTTKYNLHDSVLYIRLELEHDMPEI